MNSSVPISSKLVTDTSKPFIVAELSGNHNGDLERALELIERIMDAGADAVKIQTYTPDTMTIEHDGPEFTIKGGLWDGRTLHELYEEAHTPWEWHDALFSKAKEIGIPIFSTPFDLSAVDFLESFNVPAYKISSFEIIDIPLIQKVASTKKPMIISCGMASEIEINDAVKTARSSGNDDLILLHCISSYPTPVRDCNLRTIQHMQETFDVPIGISDHSLGTSIAIAAVALGAVVIEKHVTLNRLDGGPDAAFSLEPNELKTLVKSTKEICSALGNITYGCRPSENNLYGLRRSLYVVENIDQGQKFSGRNIRSIRPGLGLHTRNYHKIIGRTSNRNLSKGTPLSWDFINSD